MNATPYQINDYRPEVRSLIMRLHLAGFTIIKGNNGEDAFPYVADHPARFVEELIACDEGWLSVRLPGARTGSLCLYLVYGNEPGVIVADNTCNDELDEVLSEHYKAWENREQPKALQVLTARRVFTGRNAASLQRQIERAKP